MKAKSYRNMGSSSGAMWHATTWDGDDGGGIFYSINAEGVCVTNAWDAWGQLAATVRTGGGTETFQYGDRGLTNAVDRLGIATRTERDALGRVLRTIDGNGNAVQVAYVTNGVDQVSSLWDGNGNETRWNYDEWGLATNKVYADGSQEVYSYDLLGRLTNKLDPAGNTTAFSYDANGNLTSLQCGTSAPFTFGYDALDRRTNMVDAVGTTAWRYDEAGRLVGESGPFGTPEVQVAYDPNGRLTNVTWGTFSVDYSFDDLGRIVAVDASEGTYAFIYLSNGIRRATVAYPNGVTEVRAHDELARCTSLAFLSGTNSLLSIAYAYDDGDRRTNEVWSTGRAMSYGYDAAHQLVSVSAARPSDAARYRYDAAGNPVDRAELGLDVTNTFNNLNQIVTGSWTGATLTVAGAVNYPVGSITVNGQPGTIYPDSTFDVANVPVAPGTNTLTATYTGPAYTNAPMTATDTSTIVLGDTTYTHDPNGNLTSDATFLYQYDLANQLTNVIRKANNSVVLQCRYDALGRRVEAIRTDGTVDRYVYFPGTFLVLAVLDGTNAPKEFYTRGPDLSGSLSSAGGIGGLLACTYTTGSVRYHHADITGNIISLTAPAVSTIFTVCCTPFGQLNAFNSSLLPRYLFSSKEWDSDARLVYFGYRYYIPESERWLTRDTVGENGGINLYLFVGNAPTEHFDTWGQKKVCSLTVYLTHGSLATDTYDRVPHVPLPQRNKKCTTSKWGFWGCYADRYNNEVPEPQRIHNLPPVPADKKWPPEGQTNVCESVSDLLEVGKAIRNAGIELCKQKCCETLMYNILMDFNDPGKSFSHNVEYARSLLEQKKCEGNIDDLPKGMQKPVSCKDLHGLIE